MQSIIFALQCRVGKALYEHSMIWTFGLSGQGDIRPQWSSMPKKKTQEKSMELTICIFLHRRQHLMQSGFRKATEEEGKKARSLLEQLKHPAMTRKKARPIHNSNKGTDIA